MPFEPLNISYWISVLYFGLPLEVGIVAGGCAASVGKTQPHGRLDCWV